MEYEYRRTVAVVLPPFLTYLRTRSVITDSDQQLLDGYFQHLTGDKAVMPDQVVEKPAQPVVVDVGRSEPRCGTEGCDGTIVDGTLCPKCTKLNPPKQVPEKPKAKGRKPKEEEVLDEALGMYRSVDGVKYVKRGQLKIALGKFSKEGTLAPINGRNRPGLLKAGYIERLREDGNDKVMDLVHNIELVRKGEQLTIDETRLDPNLRDYCEQEGYVIEKNIKLVAIDEGRGIFLMVDHSIVIQVIDGATYAVGGYTGKEGLLSELTPQEQEVCDKFRYVIKYDKHLLLTIRERPTIEEPPQLPTE